MRFRESFASLEHITSSERDTELLILSKCSKQVVAVQQFQDNVRNFSTRCLSLTAVVEHAGRMGAAKLRKSPRFVYEPVHELQHTPKFRPQHLHCHVSLQSLIICSVN